MATSSPMPAEGDETDALLARYKRAKETEEALRPVVKELGVREMAAGRETVSSMHRKSGMTAEVFRRLGRDRGIERLREPTVGKDAPKRTSPNGN